MSMMFNDVFAPSTYYAYKGYISNRNATVHVYICQGSNSASLVMEHSD